MVNVSPRDTSITNPPLSLRALIEASTPSRDKRRESRRRHDANVNTRQHRDESVLEERAEYVIVLRVLTMEEIQECCRTSADSGGSNIERQRLIGFKGNARSNHIEHACEDGG